jgi:glutathione S-transferase
MHYCYAVLSESVVEVEDIDFAAAQHQTAEYMKVNLMKKVPALKDADFTMSESSAILCYLAERYGPSCFYPTDPFARAQVHSAIDTVQTDLSRYFPGGVVYPQLFPGGRRQNDALHAGADHKPQSISFQTALIVWRDLCCTAQS